MTAQTRSVLVVDDEPDIAANIAEFLVRKGFDARIARDGLEALETLSQNPDISLIVTDLRMPRLDGMGLLTRLRELRADDMPRIIVISGHGGDVDAASVLESGAYRFMTKPLNMKSLIALLDEKLDENRGETSGEMPDEA
ncbi:MAG: response regulator [Alphaproteobacteria bacterium]